MLQQQMTFEQYKSISAINASFLKACSFSAYQGFKYLKGPAYVSDAMDFGSAVHTVVLEPELFKTHYVISEKFDRRTNVGKAAAEAFEKATAGKIALDRDQYDLIQKIIENCKANPAVKDALKTFKREATFVWGDDVKRKARLDLVDEENAVIIDIKTTKDAGERAFISQMLALRYDIQFHHYSRALGKAATCYTITIENTTGEVALYDITDIVHSDFTVKRYNEAFATALAVRKMNECPPKFKNEIINLKLPDWAIAEGAS